MALVFLVFTLYRRGPPSNRELREEAGLINPRDRFCASANYAKRARAEVERAKSSRVVLLKS